VTESPIHRICKFTHRLLKGSCLTTESASPNELVTTLTEDNPIPVPRRRRT
jgi:hypothetical protein